MIVVVDASVALKWFLKARADEADADVATDILKAVGADRVGMLQPPHFVAEVAAVLAREKPEDAQQDLDELQRVKWSVAASPEVYALATDLAIGLRHHLFDTLYHATSLTTPNATFVTADDVYFGKARGEGGITRLAEFVLPTRPRPPLRAD